MQAVVRQNSSMVLPYLKVLLSLDPAIAAQRIGQRENRQVAIEEILVRKQRDFDRYSDLYQINGQEVTHQDLSRLADVIIDTEKNGPTEVATKILHAYIQKLSVTGQEEPTLAPCVINEINNAL